MREQSLAYDCLIIDCTLRIYCDKKNNRERSSSKCLPVRLSKARKNKVLCSKRLVQVLQNEDHLSDVLVTSGSHEIMMEEISIVRNKNIREENIQRGIKYSTRTASIHRRYENRK